MTAKAITGGAWWQEDGLLTHTQIWDHKTSIEDCVCERSTRSWQQMTSEKLENMSLGSEPRLPMCNSRSDNSISGCDEIHKVWEVWLQQCHPSTEMIPVAHDVLYHIQMGASKIIKSKPLMKQKDNSHAAWKLQLHTVKEITEKKRSDEWESLRLN